MKLYVVSILGAMERDGPGTIKSLITEVERAMKKPDGSVNSASGRTAALAVNYCERHDLEYTMTCRYGRYFVARRHPRNTE